MKQKTFAVRLQELLDEAGITPYRLAQLAGFPPQTISRFVRGEREPTFLGVLRIARALDCSLSVFDDVSVIIPKPSTPQGA